jgi:hypothetical protein
MKTAEEIAQWVIDNRYTKSENNKVSDHEMYHELVDSIKAVSGVLTDVIKRYNVVSRHDGCHPETCCHRYDICIKEINTHKIVYECDSWEEAEKKCDELNVL